mgnify:CR=1 FL=1
MTLSLLRGSLFDDTFAAQRFPIWWHLLSFIEREKERINAIKDLLLPFTIVWRWHYTRSILQLIQYLLHKKKEKCHFEGKVFLILQLETVFPSPMNDQESPLPCSYRTTRRFLIWFDLKLVNLPFLWNSDYMKIHNMICTLN